MGDERERIRTDPYIESVQCVAPDKRVVLAKRVLALLNCAFREVAGDHSSFAIGLATRALIPCALNLLEAFLLDEKPDEGLIVMTQRHCEDLALLINRKFPLDQDQER